MMKETERMEETLASIEERVRELGIRSEETRTAGEEVTGTPFVDYRNSKAKNTIRRQDAALDVFSSFLTQVLGTAPAGEDLAENPKAWYGITWELVDGFVKWMLLEGYSIGTIKVRLSTVRTYASLAAEAGAISFQELAMIKQVKGYDQAEGKLIDKRRKAAGIQTRMGAKKARSIVLSRMQVAALKDQPDTSQGRRDAVMVGLMLDLGLRVGEVASLVVGNVNLGTGELTFYRPSVEKIQTHRLTEDLWEVIVGYVTQDALAAGPLLRASQKGGRLTHAGMTERAITRRVQVLGETVGVQDLSAQDLRHTWATWAARSGTPIDLLQHAGGWSSPEIPLRYIEAARRTGIRLDGSVTAQDTAA